MTAKPPPPPPPQEEEEITDVLAYQTQLDDSVAAARALVESWIPKNLDASWDAPAPDSFTATLASRARPQRLGLGASATELHKQQAEERKLRARLLGNAGKGKGVEDPDSSRPSLSSAANGTKRPAEEESDDDEEDSRANSIKAKPAPVTLMNGGGKGVMANGAGGKTKKPKGLGSKEGSPAEQRKRSPGGSTKAAVSTLLQPVKISAGAFYGATGVNSTASSSTSNSTSPSPAPATKNKKRKNREREKAELVKRAKIDAMRAEETPVVIESPSAPVSPKGKGKEAAKGKDVTPDVDVDVAMASPSSSEHEREETTTPPSSADATPRKQPRSRVKPPFAPLTSESEGEARGLPDEDKSEGEDEEESQAPLEPAESVAPPLAPPFDPTADASDDDEFEYLASQIATKTEPDDPWATSVGAYSSSLRRRFTTRATGESGAKEPTGGDTGETEEGGRMRLAWEELEDEEVQGFLARVGKQVQEVRVAVPRDEIPYPERSAFTSVDGRTDWFGFCKAYAATLASIHTPPSLLVPPRPSRLHVSTAYSHLERLYVIVPPPVWEIILKNRLGRIWRWESENSWKWFTLYCVLWYFDLILLLPFGALLFFILRARLFPPTPEEILAQATIRVRRAAEAAQLSNELKSTSRIGFAFQGAKSLFNGIRSKGEGSALVRGLGRSAFLGGMAVGSKPLRPEAEIPKTSALARAIVGASGVTAGVGASVDELRPATTGEHREGAAEVPTSNEGKPTSLYNTATEAMRVFGPPIQEYLGQAADMAEKIKNLLVHPDHPSVEAVCLRLVLIALFLLVCPTWMIWKGAWAYLGLEFFFLWKFRELHPEWRRALMPWWWVFVGAPTDAEYATFILQKRARANKPLRGSKTIKRIAKQRARGGSRSEPAPSAEWVTAEATSSALAGVGLSAPGLRSRPPSFVEPPADIIGTYFALLHALPGTLVIRSNRITFAPTRGFRTLGLKRLSKRLVEEDSSDGDSIFSMAPDDEANVMMDVLPADVTGLKKEKRLGFDGLQITARVGTVWRLTNVVRRDDAFNKLIAISPTAWS